MKTLYTLAYPALTNDDTLRIQEFRRVHDPHYNVVQAHFTLVFGCGDVADVAYLDHIEAVARTASPIQFVCRYAMLGADAAGTPHIFLVPDEGYSGLSLLHDALYRGVLAELLRLDIPFVPHITIGSFVGRVAAKRLCDELNAAELEIRGVVNALTVAMREAHSICSIETFLLAGCESQR
jgi:2'-5' RNA ligase